MTDTTTAVAIRISLDHRQSTHTTAAAIRRQRATHKQSWCGNCGDAQRVVLGAVLAGLGAASGCLDVSINTAALSYQDAVGRLFLSRLHGGCSLGTLVGAASGALTSFVGVSGIEHFIAMSVVLVVLTLRFLPIDPVDTEATTRPDGSAPNCPVNGRSSTHSGTSPANTSPSSSHQCSSRHCSISWVISHRGNVRRVLGQRRHIDAHVREQR
jgi:hypothetical protein